VNHLLGLSPTNLLTPLWIVDQANDSHHTSKFIEVLSILYCTVIKSILIMWYMNSARWNEVRDLRHLRFGSERSHWHFGRWEAYQWEREEATPPASMPSRALLSFCCLSHRFTGYGNQSIWHMNSARWKGGSDLHTFNIGRFRYWKRSLSFWSLGGLTKY
jgi:hypothetical protein